MRYEYSWNNIFGVHVWGDLVRAVCFFVVTARLFTRKYRQPQGPELLGILLAKPILLVDHAFCGLTYAR